MPILLIVCFLEVYKISHSLLCWSVNPSLCTISAYCLIVVFPLNTYIFFQVKSGTIFDNVLITDDVDFAKEFGESTWGKTKVSTETCMVIHLVELHLFITIFHSNSSVVLFIVTKYAHMLRNTYDLGLYWRKCIHLLCSTNNGNITGIQSHSMLGRVKPVRSLR